MAGFTEKLVPDVRLQIYPYLLAFDHPLYRVHRLKGNRQTESDHKHVNISILFVCKKVYFEAFHPLIKLNNIILTHVDIHPLGGRLPLLKNQSEFLGRVYVTVAAAMFNWTHCPDCGSGITAFLDAFNCTNFPNLTQLIVDLDGMAYGLRALREQVEHYGSSIRFVGVGKFEVANKASDRTITFEYRNMALLFKYLRSVLKEVPAAGQPWMMYPPQVIQFIPKVPKTMLEHMCTVFLGAYHPRALPFGMHQYRFPTGMLGVEFAWLEPSMQDETTFETLTAAFLRGNRKLSLL